MATHSGSKGKVFVGSDQIAEVKSWSMEEESDLVDASIIGTEWRKNQATIKSWRGEISAYWDETDTAGQGMLTIGSTVTLNLYPAGDDSGSTYFSGDVIIQNISRSGAFDGIVEAGFTFTGSGALSVQTVV